MRSPVKCEHVLPETMANIVFKDPRRIKTKIVADSSDFIPIYKHEDDACCDLKANVATINTDFAVSKYIVVEPMQTVKIDCGMSMAVPNGYEAQIRCRSGLGSRGIIVTNSPGTIDHGFTGRICVLLTNLSKEPFVVNHLDRIAQMSLKPVWRFDFIQTDTLDNTERGEGGWGSTGV